MYTGDFEDVLRHLGLRKRGLAEALGVRPETVTRWGLNPPEYVWAYLRLRLKVETMRDEFSLQVSEFAKQVKRI